MSKAGVGIAGFGCLAIVGSLALSLFMLGASVWVIIWVLQQMGVI